MPEIRENSDIVTQITTVKVPPDHQSEVLDLMSAYVSHLPEDVRGAASGWPDWE